eukprot:7659645-Alexandrium_andersonii.AAC.1
MRRERLKTCSGRKLVRLNAYPAPHKGIMASACATTCVLAGGRLVSLLVLGQSRAQRAARMCAYARVPCARARVRVCAHESVSA